jgi:para-aminobenzoate synthetase/4-amino-4-deoxychorismate lyase
LRSEPGSCESPEEGPVPLLSPEIDWTRYEEAFQRIQGHLEAGDTYQVNYTYRLRARWEHALFALYRQLCRSQGSAYCAWLQWGPYRILSASPELFFSLKDRELTVRPMKGTAPRGRWLEEDEEFAQALHRCPKNRAENVMIVDLLRNDLGRIAQPGSVCVEKLFEIERYETVLQMTSSIAARGKDRLSLAALFQALQVPCQRRAVARDVDDFPGRQG